MVYKLSNLKCYKKFEFKKLVTKICVILVTRWKESSDLSVYFSVISHRGNSAVLGTTWLKCLFHNQEHGINSLLWLPFLELNISNVRCQAHSSAACLISLNLSSQNETSVPKITSQVLLVDKRKGWKWFPGSSGGDFVPQSSVKADWLHISNLLHLVL